MCIAPVNQLLVVDFILSLYALIIKLFAVVCHDNLIYFPTFKQKEKPIDFSTSFGFRFILIFPLGWDSKF